MSRFNKTVAKLAASPNTAALLPLVPSLLLEKEAANAGSFALDVGKKLVGSVGAAAAIGLGTLAFNKATNALLGNQTTADARANELGKLTAQNEFKGQQLMRLNAQHKNVFNTVIKDEVIRDAEPALMRSTYDTMKRFAPNLAADPNAAKSFLREHAIYGAGPSYAALKNLADAEQAVSRAGGMLDTKTAAINWGSVARGALEHGAIGAGTGAITGAIGAGEGRRMEGALRGGLAGGALGAVGGGVLGGVVGHHNDAIANATSQFEKERSALLTRDPLGVTEEAIRALPSYKTLSDLGNKTDTLSRAGLGSMVGNPLATGALGYGAGSTAALPNEAKTAAINWGAVGRAAAQHGATGAATGALGGAIGAGEGRRLEGALRGGAVGGALGALGGGALEGAKRYYGHTMTNAANAYGMLPNTATPAGRESAEYKLFKRLSDNEDLAKRIYESGKAINPVAAGAAGYFGGRTAAPSNE